MLIVGGNDTEVVRLNRDARTRMSAESELVVIPGAGHLFEEPGALEQVTDRARRWFATHFQRIRTEGLQT